VLVLTPPFHVLLLLKLALLSLSGKCIGRGELGLLELRLGDWRPSWRHRLPPTERDPAAFLPLFQLGIPRGHK
jgi:hypothetical protein